MIYNMDDVEYVTLLSLDEFRENRDKIPNVRTWWWLRTPGSYAKNAAYIFIDGDEYASGYKVNSNASVRPVFYMKPEIDRQLFPGTKIQVGNYMATVMDDRGCLLDRNVCKHRFDDDSNDWDDSEIKAFIESNEFMDMVFK